MSARWACRRHRFDRYELRVGSYTAGQSHPREFSLDPSGKFVLIANQKSNQIVVVERDDKTGLLGKTVQKLPMDAPGDLKFLVRQ